MGHAYAGGYWAISIPETLIDDAMLKTRGKTAVTALPQIRRHGGPWLADTDAGSIQIQWWIGKDTLVRI